MKNKWHILLPLVFASLDFVFCHIVYNFLNLLLLSRFLNFVLPITPTAQYEISTTSKLFKFPAHGCVAIVLVLFYDFLLDQRHIARISFLIFWKTRCHCLKSNFCIPKKFVLYLKRVSLNQIKQTFFEGKCPSLNSDTLSSKLFKERFSLVGKRLDKKVQVNFKIYDVIHDIYEVRKHIIAIISKSKGNKALKFWSVNRIYCEKYFS